MLGPILQAAWQQIGPMAQQLFTLAAPYISKVPPPMYPQLAKGLSKEASNWYNSLDPQNRETIDKVIAWAAKDLAGDIAAAATGLPISSLVEKVLSSLEEKYKNHPKARIYVNDELTRQLKKTMQAHK